MVGKSREHVEGDDKPVPRAWFSKKVAGLSEGITTGVRPGRRFQEFDETELFIWAAKFGVDPALELFRAIHESDPTLTGAFTPEKAEEYLQKKTTERACAVDPPRMNRREIIIGGFPRGVLFKYF